MIASLCGLALLSLWHPISVFGIPLFVTEAFLFPVYAYATRKESVIAVGVLILGLLLFSPFVEYTPLGVVFVLIIEMLFVRTLLNRFESISVTEAIIASYAVILPMLGYFYLIDHGTWDLMLVQLSRKFFDLVVCTFLFQTCEKTIVAANHRFDSPVPLFGDEFRLKEFVQGVISSGLCALIALLLVIQASLVNEKLAVGAELTGFKTAATVSSPIALNDSSRVVFLEDREKGFVIWSNAGRIVNGVSLLAGYAPGKAFVDYRKAAEPGTITGSESFIVRVDAWPVLRFAYTPFVYFAVGGFALTLVFVLLCGWLVSRVLGPSQAYALEALDSARFLASTDNRTLRVPEVKDSLVCEAVQMQAAFTSLFTSIAQISNENRLALDSYDSLVSTAPVGILVCDWKGRVVHSNSALDSITGLLSGGVKVIKREAEGLLYSRSERAEVSVAGMPNAEDARVLSISVTPRLGMSGDTDGYWAFVLDLTEERRMESQMAESEKLVTLGRMTTEIAHEMNQPLSALSVGHANAMALLEADSPDLQKLRRKMERMKIAIDRTARVTERMRAYGRNRGADGHTVDIRDVVADAVSECMGEAEQKGVTIERELAWQPLAVCADHVGLQEAVVNLLRNAIQAAARENVSPHVQLEVYEREGRAVVKIRDNGGGVKKGDTALIFEPFYTVEGCGNGIGLGASLAYGIVDELHGSVKAKNVDNGLEVTVAVPLGPDAATPARAVSA